MLIYDKDITSYQLLLKQDRVLVNQVFASLTGESGFFLFFFFDFLMGNETFYWDGLTYTFCGGVKVGKTFWFMIYSYLTDNAFTGVKRGVRKE